MLMLDFSTNDEHYQVYDCDTKTSQVLDIINLSGPDCSARIMYELEAYENYLWGWSLTSGAS